MNVTRVSGATSDVSPCLIYIIPLLVFLFYLIHKVDLDPILHVEQFLGHFVRSQMVFKSINFSDFINASPFLGSSVFSSGIKPF